MAKTILAVDDSKSIPELVRFALEPMGYGVVLAEDGVEGLERLGEGKVDLVITDLNMPRMDGLEFISAVRRDGRYAGLPMIMLTTEGQAETMRSGKQAGASGWIVKPFNDLQLEMTVRKFIGKPD
ncbi:response regulator [Limibaculum sp. FT325]|uniref:response regulator n=1 Tax=Thermohalobaculum sediminis TaxID=2939436 RepID=UPI0020BE9AFE|nr:response regulator [Limibaculum sediminis]MCL5776513.1 response regulator [Limibaculum sediminis]